MITGRRLLVSSAAFGIAIAIVYWFSSHNLDGTVLLGIMAIALLFAAGFMFFAEREAHLISDRIDAANADAKGERLGTITVASPWPILSAFGLFLVLLGLVVYPVLSVFGFAVLFFALVRFGRESR